MIRIADEKIVEKDGVTYLLIKCRICKMSDIEVIKRSLSKKDL
jgi:hypothetical protein